MDTGILSRADALRILFRWMASADFPDRMLGDIDADRRGFVMELVYTTVRWARLLDDVLAPRFRQPPPAEAEAALLLGVCQLLKLTHIPSYAVVHATIEALKEVGGRRTPVGLVNAVLRDVERSRDRILAELAAKPLALRTSHPDELVERWTARWGLERATALCDWNNEPAEITVVTLPQGPDAVAILARLRDAGIVASPHPVSPEAIVVGHGTRVEDLPGFAEGDFTVQDPATLDAVRLLDVCPGQRVLDACASPGGKAARIARLLTGQGQLVALERHADRLPMLHATLARLARGTRVDVRQVDATEVDAQALGGPFDRILLDVPCSNTGVLRRRPDARWRVDGERRRLLTGLQARLLDRAASLLAPGGRLVYSTCSIDTAENEEHIASFLQHHRGYAVREVCAHVPPGMDGAYAAALSKSP